MNSYFPPKINNIQIEQISVTYQTESYDLSSRIEAPSRKDEKITLKVKDELLLFPQNEI